MFLKPLPKSPTLMDPRSYTTKLQEISPNKLMWGGVWGVCVWKVVFHSGMHFSQSKNSCGVWCEGCGCGRLYFIQECIFHNQKLHFYLILIYFYWHLSFPFLKLFTPWSLCFKPLTFQASPTKQLPINWAREKYTFLVTPSIFMLDNGVDEQKILTFYCN